MENKKDQGRHDHGFIVKKKYFVDYSRQGQIKEELKFLLFSDLINLLINVVD